MDYQNISPEEIKQALDFSAAQIKRYLPQFTDKFQNAYSVNHFYEPIENVDWTNGFWTGEIWLMNTRRMKCPGKPQRFR